MKRIIVTQADARQRGGQRDPLEVGVVRWRGAGDWLSIVVKMSIGFGGAEGEILPAQELSRALSAEHPYDFVVFKPRCDLMVVGHAHAQDPIDRIEVSVALNELEQSFAAIAFEPAPSIPLTVDHLSDRLGEPLTLAPRAVTRETEDVGFDTFDHASVQSAAPFMQLEPIEPGATLNIRGLSVREERRKLTFPKLAPRAWVEGSGGVLTELALRCDTILFDTDFERVDLCFRTVLPEAKRAPNRFLVSLERTDEPHHDIETIARDLPRGTVGWATEEVEIEAHDEELEMASYEVLEFAAEPEMPLEDFADVSAKLSEQDRPRKEIIDDLELDERSWGIEERAWVEKMGNAASDGDGSLAAEFAALFLVAQDRLKKPHEPQPMETYASVKAELERANKPNELLEKRGLCFGEWMRLERHWSDEATKDPAVATKLKKLLGAARAAQRS